MKNLEFFLRNLRRRNPKDAIALSGDYNLTPEFMKSWSRQENIHIMPTAADHYTRQALVGGRSTLDYILSNFLNETAIAKDAPISTDHRVVEVSLKGPFAKHSSQIVRLEHRLRRNVRQE